MGDHYIPRFLLRRFQATSTQSGQAMVFQFQRGQPVPKSPFPVDRIASERDFYDLPGGADVDGAGMHTHEKQAGKALAVIEGGASPENHRQDLAMLLSVLTVRTRAMRDEISEMVEKLLDAGHRAMAAPAWNHVVQDHIRNRFEEVVREAIKAQPQQVRDRVEALLETPEGVQALRGHFGNFNFSAAGDAFMAGVRSRIDPSFAARKAQVDALFRVLREHVVRWFDGVRFEVRELPEADGRLVLGDACVVGQGEDGSFGHPMKIGRSCRARFLPIGPYKLLVAASAGEACPQISADELNRECAKLSREFFFSAGCGERESALLDVLGTGPAIVTCEEMREIAIEALGKFPT